MKDQFSLSDEAVVTANFEERTSEPERQTAADFSLEKLLKNLFNYVKTELATSPLIAPSFSMAHLRQFSIWKSAATHRNMDKDAHRHTHTKEG